MLGRSRRARSGQHLFRTNQCRHSRLWHPVLSDPTSLSLHSNKAYSQSEIVHRMLAALNLLRPHFAWLSCVNGTLWPFLELRLWSGVTTSRPMFCNSQTLSEETTGSTEVLPRLVVVVRAFGAASGRHLLALKSSKPYHLSLKDNYATNIRWIHSLSSSMDSISLQK